MTARRPNCRGIGRWTSCTLNSTTDRGSPPPRAASLPPREAARVAIGAVGEAAPRAPVAADGEADVLVSGTGLARVGTVAHVQRRRVDRSSPKRWVGVETVARLTDIRVPVGIA